MSFSALSDIVIKEIRPTLLFFVVLVLIKLSISYYIKNKKLPPGPWGVPLFGYLPFLGKDIHLKLTELSKKYKGVFRIHLGNETVIVVSQYDLIRDAFRREEFSGRPSTVFSKLLDGYGIINSDGELWQSQRKFLHRQFREFGVHFSGKIESRIKNEVEYFLSSLAKLEQRPVDLNVILSTCISNVISSLVMSVRFREDNKCFLRFLKLMDDGFRLYSMAQIVNCIPVCKYLPFMNTAYNQLKKNKDEIMDFIDEIISMHKESFDPNYIRDLTDAYLNDIYNAQSNGTQDQLFSGKDPDKQLRQIIGDFFSAGQETVKTTLLWAILFILKHSEVQTEIQKELDNVVGADRLPILENMSELPYTEATILETLRRSSVAALGTVHATTSSVKFNDFELPKGTSVVPLLWAVHMDNNLWDEPDKFNPRRFLTEDGKLIKPPWFVPFGVGRRMCLGDTLAKMEIFLFLTSLLHLFDLRESSEFPLPDFEAECGATLKPKSFKVISSFKQSTIMIGNMQMVCIPRKPECINQADMMQKRFPTLMEVLF